MADLATPDERIPPPRAAGGLAILAAVVALGFVGSRLLGVVRTIAIADAFGSSPDLAAYFVAFRIPDRIFQVLAGATLGSAFIPVFARIWRRQGEEEAWRLASNVLNLVTVATAGLCVVAFVLAPWLVPLTAPGLGDEAGRPDELTDKAVDLTRLMLLSPLVFAVSGIVTGILNARQRFLLSALAPMLYNLAIIFGAVVLADRWGVEGLAVGVVIGAGLHRAIQLPALWRERMRYRMALDWADATVREVARLMGPRVIGLAAVQLNFVITIFFASKIGDRAINDLTYAWLLAQLPLALFAMAISTAVFPTLAEQVADEDQASLRQTVSRALGVIMVLTIPAALGLALLRDPVTQVLLQRGEFTAADTSATAAALAFYCIGVVPQAGIEIHSRGFYALGDTRTPVALAVIAMVLNLVLAAALWSRFEHEGLAFAISAASWVEWVGLYWLFARRSGHDPRPELEALTRFAVAAAVMAVVLAVALVLLDSGSQLQALTIAVAGGVAGAASYGAMAAWLRVPEIEPILSRAETLLRRRRPRS